MWADVLRAMPTARMIIKTTSLGDRGTLLRAAERFAASGLPMERVQLLPPTRTESEHVAQYRLIDIALDTFPYCGTTTTCEALSMGVPVVSRVGGHHAARVGLSILSAAGHAEWATDDPDRYVKIAAELSGDIPRLSQIRAALREKLRQSVLCDSKSFAAKIEGIYRDACEVNRVAWASRPSNRA
jgi:predicted O-linked N-acetylglucosamine transferase (SPINDLY family)